MNEDKTLGCKQPITTKGEIFQYGFGGATLNIAYMTVSSYLIFFWTDYAGVSAAVAGLIYFVGRLVMAFSDIIAGIVTDNTNTRYGKFRPYLMVATPIVSVLFFFLFMDYPLGGTAKTILYSAMMIVFCMFFAFQTVAYEALVPSMSSDLSKRNFVVMARQVLGTSISVAALSATIPLVEAFGGGTRGWNVTIGIYGVVCFLFMCISLNGCKNHDVCDEVPEKRQTAKVVWKNLKQILSAKPVIILVAAFGLIIVCNEVTGATNMYLFKYAIGNETLFSVAIFAALPANILAAILTPFLVAKLGKKKVFLFACLIAMVRPLVILFVQPFDNTAVIISLYVIAQFGMIMAVVDVWMMVADCVEYIKLTKKLDSAGLVTSCNTFMMDFGGAIAGIVVGGLMTFIGYTGADTISESTLNGIIFLNAGIPVIAAIGAIIVHRFYSITNKVLAELGANVGNQAIN